MTDKITYTLYNVGFDWENIYVEKGEETVRKFPSPPRIKSGPIQVEYPPLGGSVDVSVPVGKNANLQRLLGFSHGKLSLQPMGTPNDEQLEAQEIIGALDKRNETLEAERDNLANLVATQAEQLAELQQKFETLLEKDTPEAEGEPEAKQEEDTAKGRSKKGKG